ncbi:kinase-like protein [Coprinellus micaceus]|uniref:Kinase-like protein n=1 Tax=Coprinellus micaceus TaxID=71717 RepID=A0A4Y7SL14_COPMI|nr:kinase-like protein [Coprinellus micaceus]
MRFLIQRFSGQVLDGETDDPGTPASERGKFFKALLSLSKSTGLYPQCLQLSHQVQKCDEPVAAGAFGEVFRGSVGDREVAIKVFRVYETTNVVKFKKRAWAEAILWCQLYHANVLPCYGIHHLHNQPSRIGLVSPWMGSGNVVDYLRANPTAERPLLLSDIASGMSYLHENNIVHGDLKGANILVSESGRASLADFGLSRVSGPALLTSVVTGTAKNTGTIRWLAPELLSLEDDADPKVTRTSDVYSYGCACYEIMTGNIPFFQTRNNYSIPALVLAGGRPRRPDPTDPAYQEYGLTEEIWSLIERCWKHDAIQRPTAVEIEEYDLFNSLADPRPAQQWGYASAAEFRRLIMPPSLPGS